jgi:hypothetical protein
MYLRPPRRKKQSTAETAEQTNWNDGIMGFGGSIFCPTCQYSILPLFHFFIPLRALRPLRLGFLYPEWVFPPFPRGDFQNPMLSAAQTPAGILPKRKDKEKREEWVGPR